MKAYNIRVFQEGSQWVAEFKTIELAAVGPTVYEALEALGLLFAAKGLGDQPQLIH